MRICRFLHAGRARIGLVVDDLVVPIERPGDTITLISQWAQMKRQLDSLVGGLESAVPRADVTLLAPIARPGKIMAIGLNYADHIAESGLGTPEHQTWFAKASTSVAAPFQDIQLPRVSTAVDYEAELVVVIGRPGRHISAKDALSHVFGYAVGNDVSVRDWQLRTPQWTLGKSFDTHAPFGPWIVTADEVDPNALDIRCHVNGELRQSSNTKNLVFDVARQIEHLSQAMTLEPGDLIFTGTPGGVGMAAKPPTFLKANDVVRVEIQKLGAIQNRFVPE